MKKLALLIGVSEYKPGLAQLPAALADIAALERVLKDPEMGGFDEVSPLANPDVQKMRLEIGRLFSRAGKDDSLVMLYFSGHGIKCDDTGTLYFATADTETAEFRFTALESEFVHRVMNNCRCKRQVIILDCCFSGAFDPSLQAKDDGSVDLRTQLGAQGRVVLTSSSSTEYSFEQPGANGQPGASLSIYTRYLVEGIETGANGGNENGYVSIHELHEYARKKVMATAPKMTPKIITLKDEGFDIYLTKVPVGDPVSKYWEIASKYIINGVVSPVGRVILDQWIQRLGLTPQQASEIEAKARRPFELRLENLQKYRQILIEQIKFRYPFNEEDRKNFNDVQRSFGLTDEDIRPIHQEEEDRARKVQGAAPSARKDDASAAAKAEAERREEEERARKARIESAAKQAPPLIQITIDRGAIVRVGNQWQTKTESITRAGHRQELTKEIAITMLHIPAGEFRMGSSDKEVDRSTSEAPQHRVQLQSFFLGQTPVTQAQWKLVAGWPKLAVDLNPQPSNFKGANRPVEQVSWEEAMEFCRRLSQRTELSYTLPSEAQWEYACRAGTTTPFAFGDTLTPDIANYDGNYTYGSGPKGTYREKTTDVGSFLANAWGLQDMHGNVWEWCLDHWHENYQGAPSDGTPWVNGGDEALRLLRGGSWFGSPRYCRSASRLRGPQGSRNSDVGFRLCGFPPGLLS
jgi:formylglycine-generating enzyme required for sulfatase activity